jgi:hypothetical protein
MKYQIDFTSEEIKLTRLALLFMASEFARKGLDEAANDYARIAKRLPEAA